MSSWPARILIAALGCVLLYEALLVAPALAVVTVGAVFLWFALPGVQLAGELLVDDPAANRFRWLLGPILGLGGSVLGLLLLWGAGIQNILTLLLAPFFAWILVWAARQSARVGLRMPEFSRRDSVAVAALLWIVPLVTLVPFDRVREMTADGEAYRAYFTADFVWAMSATAELAKGDVPPANPFLSEQPLRYYWLSHLLSGALYRVLSPWGVTSEAVLLLDSIAFGLLFIPFFYALVRSAGASAGWAAVGVALGFLANSFEGLERLLVLWEMQAPLDALRVVNIDAVTRWFYFGMPVDGLQRMLLYQAHHLTGYALALAALWVVARAETVTTVPVPLWAGGLLGLAFLFSTFTAIIVGVAVGLVYAWRLAQARAWRAAPRTALLGAVPVAAGVLVSFVLGYTDPAEGSLFIVGANPVAFRRWPLMLLLSFGPLLLIGIAGLVRVGWSASAGAGAAALTIAALLFYFLVDVPSLDGVWVGWRSGHLLLIALAVSGAVLLTELWKQPRLRLPVLIGLTLVTVAAVPTVAIDVWNAQDIENPAYAQSFPWTLTITPLEREGLEWIRQNTPADALVQVDPRARHSGTWAYVPAFAERRMAAGLPISMIPLRPYELATDNVSFGIFRAQNSRDAWETAQFLGIDYVLIGQPERRASPRVDQVLGGDGARFRLAFSNSALTIYEVVPR